MTVRKQIEKRLYVLLLLTWFCLLAACGPYIVAGLGLITGEALGGFVTTVGVAGDSCHREFGSTASSHHVVHRADCLVPAVHEPGVVEQAGRGFAWPTRTGSDACFDVFLVMEPDRTGMSD
jgi:hypothetical protein